MAWPKIKDVRELNDSEISEKISLTKKELLDLRMQKATGKLEQPHKFKVARRQLSHLMAVQRERELANSQTSEG